MAALVGLMGLAVVIHVKSRRRGAEWRQRAEWDAKEFLDAAAVYGLAVAKNEAQPSRWNQLKLVRESRLEATEASIGILRGTVRGRAVALLERRTRPTDVRRSVVGIAELDRSFPGFTLRPRPTRLGRISEADDAEFDQLFKAKGDVGNAISPALRVWLSANARAFSFEVKERSLACRNQHGSQLVPSEIGVYLAALIGFAERLEDPSA